MNCSKCKSDKSVKNGIVSSRQRYKCNDCGYNYTVDKKSDVKSDETKRIAISMYIEGLSFRTIGKILNISYGTVYQWVKDLDKQTKTIHLGNTVKTVEIEDMEHYIHSSKNNDCYGLMLIDLKNGLSILSVKKQ